MKKIISLLLISFSLNVLAQSAQDPKAKVILDDLSKTTKGYKTITADFVFVMANKDKKQLEKWVGKAQIKGQKFRMEIPGNTIVCDGKTLWNYNKDAKEVTIKNFEVASDDQLNPSKIFTIYETGFNYKYDKDEKVGTSTCAIVDLYPTIKPEKKKFHTIKLYVDRTKKQVALVKMMMKDGGTTTYEVKSLKPNTEIVETTFTFDTKGLKADQIIDERD